MSSGTQAEVVEAFDINDVTNDVYEHNFGHHPCQVRPDLTPKVVCGFAILIPVRTILCSLQTVSINCRFILGPRQL
jgi:hypothetical protein